MPAQIDVYRDWLKITETARPLNYYQLLRVTNFEDNVQLIRDRYRRMNEHVRKFAAGEYAKQSQDLLNELARAMLCLTDAQRKREYDASLGREGKAEGRRRSLEEILLANKVIDTDQLNKARNFANAIGLEVRDAIVQQKLAAPEVVVQAYAESQGLPYIDLGDIQISPELIPLVPAGIARQYGRFSAVDNTFCTPYLQQPFQYGVDFIVHSTTKYLNGHGNSIAGAIVGRDLELMKGRVWQAMKLTGTNANPWDAWLTHNGMKTLALRMDRHSANALAVAQFLENHPKVERVNYNGLPSHPDHALAKKQMRAFGGMLSFELKGGLEAGIHLMNSLRFCTLAPTLGDVDTLALHPASMSHINIPKEVRLQNGITDGLVRLSVGIENVQDIIADLEGGM
ncbi:MAG: PLP-dependent transferase [Pirellulales bacterium]|nr:PLP-dependent transferase [Pirellulales bacterium]